MELEVKESLTGAFVPLHLLDFEGNTEVQSYYRYVVENGYRQGIHKLDLGQCELCFSKLFAKDHPRLRSGRKRTKQINKLISKATQEKYESKFRNKTLRTFFSSPQNLTIRCKECLHANKKAIMTNKELIELRKRHRNEASGLIFDFNNEDEPKISRKKRKKMKRKARLQAAEKLEGEATPTVKLEDSERIETKVTDMEPAAATSSGNIVRQSKNRTPNLSVPHISNKVPASKYQSSLASRIPKLKGGAQQKGSWDSGIGKNRKLSKHKQLQAFLKASEQEKPSSSLSDFLASL